MKKQIIVLLWILTCSFKIDANPIKGRGYSPNIGKDIALGRMLATWDAISDALVKAQGTVDGSLSMENELIKSHRITFQNELNKVRLIERSCVIHQEEVQCEALIDLQPSNAFKKSVKLELTECSANKFGPQFCFFKEKETHHKGSLGFVTELVLQIQIRWGVDAGQHILFTESITARGLGVTESRSITSGMQQARLRVLQDRAKWNRIYQSYLDLKPIVIPLGFGKKLEVYLQLMGAHTFQIRGKRFLLVPKIIHSQGLLD